MPNIYDIDYNLQADNLNAPQRRLPKITAFLHSLVKPLQWRRDLFFIEYATGSYGLYSLYDPLNGYNFGDRVIYSDRKVYEAIFPTPFAGVPPTDTAHWALIVDNFIGLNERIKYTSQIITFEYAINRWFMNTGATDQIYIQNNNTIQSVFVMGQTGPFSSAMAVSSLNSTSFMAVNPTFSVQYNFTIFVPLALFNSLGNTTQDKENTIRRYADQFVLAGLLYDVQTF